MRTSVSNAQRALFRSPAQPWLRDIVAGLHTTFAVIPSAVASGVLAFSFLGQAYAAYGAVAGLYGLILTAPIAALAARSAAMISLPRSGSCLIVLAIGGFLQASPNFQNNVPLILAATALCITVAGVMQVLLGLCGVARLVAYTPYAVLAGFSNGVGIAIIYAQVKPILISGAGQRGEKLGLLIFVCGAAATVYFYRYLTALLPKVLKAACQCIPASIAAIVVWSAAYYSIRIMAPSLAPGGAMGALEFTFPPPIPLVGLGSDFITAALKDTAFLAQLALLTFMLALFASLETLTAFPVLEKITKTRTSPRRDFVAYGIGNAIGGFANCLPCAAGPAPTAVACREGGTTRLVSLTVGLSVLFLVMVFPKALAAIPVAVLHGLLVYVGVTLLDFDSLKLLWKMISGPRNRPKVPLSEMVLLAAVTLSTAFVSVLAGIIVSIALSCLFLVVALCRKSNAVHVKEFREGGSLDRPSNRIDLGGVLFFGGCRKLEGELADALATATVLYLNLSRVTHIDFTCAKMFSELSAKARAAGKSMQFEDIPPDVVEMLRSGGLAV